jgi:hypothetical protein
MKKGKYIDYNIQMACLSKCPQTIANLQQPLNEKKDIVQEFYETLFISGRPITVAGANNARVPESACWG